jgi:hypothetical protein
MKYIDKIELPAIINYSCRLKGKAIITLLLILPPSTTSPSPFPNGFWIIGI